MKKSSKLFFSLTTTLVLIFGTISYGVASNDVVVYAASKNTTLAISHVNHLYNSLHNNYLGIKNQGQWQEYIKKIRGLIAGIPSSESAEKNRLTNMVNSAERLVNAIARINQVEKSMVSNTPRMGNVRQWDFYLILSQQDLSKVDVNAFSKELNELESRLTVCYDKVNEVAMLYDSQYVKVLDAYNKAEQSKMVDEAKVAYNMALKLPGCEETSSLILDCKMLIVSLGGATVEGDEKRVIDGYFKLQDVLLTTGIEVNTTRVEVIASSIKGIVGADINVAVTRVFYNKDTSEEVFDIVLSKGGFKLFPIGVYFK
ncbi:MAG: hypothetical protein RSA01_06135 [Clostridium sp.]|uniref:hypothetical protein n=1 Tax=Clostridium sp. TaxID=1506 RepID=UPI002FC9DC6D